MAAGGVGQALALRQAVHALLESIKQGDLPSFKRAARGYRDGEPSALREVRDDYGRCLLHHAAQLGHAKLVEHMLDKLGFDVNDADAKGETPLALAAATNKSVVVSLLLSKGAAVSQRKEPGGTAPVHRAACVDTSESLQLLLDAGADVNMASDTGSPLCWAAGAGAVEAVKLLLSKGAVCDTTSANEVSPLSMAAGAGSPETVAALLAAGAKPNTLIRGGATALHVAAAVGGDEAVAIKIIEQLIKAGADANVQDQDSHHAVTVAVAAGRLKVAEVLLPHTKPISGVEPWGLQGLVEYATKRFGAAKQDVGSSGAGTSGSKLSIAIPEAPQPDKEKAAEHKRKGDEAFVKQDFSAAVEAYTASLRHDTSSAIVWANRAAAYLRTDQPAAALEDARRSRALDDTYAKAWYREGAALAALKQWEEAAGAFFEGCQLVPSNKDFEAAFQNAIAEGRKEYLAKQQQAGK